MATDRQRDPTDHGLAFPSTCWSRILGHPERAQGPDLEALAKAYWRPVYGYIRARGRSADDAADATQEFFAWMLESDFFGRADPERGRFRGFLKTSLAHFLTDLERRRRAAKRGGGRSHLSLTIGEEATELDLPDSKARTPEEILDLLWRTELIERATKSLEQELEMLGKGVYYRVFRDYFLAPEEGVDYRVLADRYQISLHDVSNYLMYAKRRYRAHLRAAVLETVSSPDDLEAELSWLFEAGRG